MGVDLLSSTERTEISAAMEDLHTTFARKVTVVKEKNDGIVLQSNDFNYFSDETTENIDYTPKTTEVDARILYLDKPVRKNLIQFNAIGQGGQTGGDVAQKYGDVRIKVRTTECEPIYDCDYIIIDGHNCVVNSNNRPHSIENKLQFTTFYLTRRE